MKILLVGAGAVGQVYGRHLQLGGASVSFFVKPKYADDCRKGFSLYPLNRRHPRQKAQCFKPDSILVDVAAVEGTRWDQIFLCLSSPALRGGWIEPFMKASGDATIVMLQPGIEDRDHLLRFVPNSRLVCGMISFLSYHAPMPGEIVPEPGMAYWFFPFAPSPFSGPRDRRDAVINALKRGRCPAVAHDDVPREVAFPSALLMTLIAGLQASGWSFPAFSKSEYLDLACKAHQETTAILSKHWGFKAPLWAKALKPGLVRAVLRLAPLAVPVDLEAYLRVHFTKVGDQTRMYLDEYIRLGKTLSLKTNSIEALFQKLAALQ